MKCFQPTNPKLTVLACALAAGIACGQEAQVEAKSPPVKLQPQSEARTPGAPVKVDEKLPAYVVVQGVSGNINSIGSDTMNELMTLWLEGFTKRYPNVTHEMEGKGSGSAPPALIAGKATFGPMSRTMKAKEEDDFEKKFEYKPTAVVAALDALAIYVHKDNPINSLTLQQADAIFSKTRKGGFDKDVRTWGDLGLPGEWADKPISLYGRNSSSGTYGFFKEHALFSGDFKDAVKEQPGSSSVVQGIASDKYGIGYSGIGYKTADVRTLSIAKDAKSKPIEATVENVYNGEYPLWRYLYVYVNYKPGSSLDPLRREFLTYALSRDGQQDTIKAGFFPVMSPVARKNLAAVKITQATVSDAGAAR